MSQRKRTKEARITAEVMAESDTGHTTIEDLPYDALAKIFVHVAGPPQGAVDVVRAFAVSKTFRKCYEDENVLRAVHFRGPHIPTFDAIMTWKRYPSVVRSDEPKQNFGGLVFRCAKAGNLHAQVNLARCILYFASLLFKAKDENLRRTTPDICGKPETVEAKLKTMELLIEQLSAENIDSAGEMARPRKLLHYDMVKSFFYHGKFVGWVSRCLEDYMKYFVKPGREIQHQLFLESFQQFLEQDFSGLAMPLAPSELSSGSLSAICSKTIDMFLKFQVLEKEYLCCLEKSLVQTEGHVNAKTLFQRLHGAECILMRGEQLELVKGHLDLLSAANSLHRAVGAVHKRLRSQLREEFIRSELIPKFDAVFDL